MTGSIHAASLAILTVVPASARPPCGDVSMTSPNLTGSAVVEIGTSFTWTGFTEERFALVGREASGDLCLGELDQVRRRQHVLTREPRRARL